MLTTEPTHITIVTQADRYKACVEYIFLTFQKTYGYKCAVVPEGQPSPSDSQLTIFYGMEGNSSQDKAPSIHIPRCGFWSHSFGRTDSPPAGFNEQVLCAADSAFSTLGERFGSDFRLYHDVIAASFYLLSGYPEWVIKERDRFGRFLSSQVPVIPQTWELPMVNHWMRQLDELIRGLVQGENAVSPSRLTMPGIHTACLTHDVDLLKKYRWANLPRHMFRSAKSGKFSSELTAARQVLGGKQRDPYDSFDQLYTVKERISAPSTYFFLGAQPSSKNGDYHTTDRDVRNLMVRAKSFGDEIGLHGSWESACSPAKLQNEKSQVEQSSGSGTIHGSRQHYLRFSNPETWNSLVDNKIRYDASGGFPDVCGFKYGWSGCFQPFDLNAMKPIPVIEIPLICMDVTLAAYEKIPAELALERLTNMLDAACENVQGGAFVFLWHNTIADRTAYPGYWDTFEYFFSVASGSARFVTMSQLCDEYETRHFGA